MQTKQENKMKMGKYARVRAAMAEYGFPIRSVMCGKIINGKFYLVNKKKL
jgi:hypothetical protein